MMPTVKLQKVTKSLMGVPFTKCVAKKSYSQQQCYNEHLIILIKSVCECVPFNMPFQGIDYAVSPLHTKRN